jgi:histidinol-phosphatase (PHP family)
MVEAQRLKEAYASQLNILIGFESEWIRPQTRTTIRRIMDKYNGKFDFFLGSVHHVHTYPIDFDAPMYDAALSKAGGTDEKLFEAYFDAQDEMLRALKPPIVGHFDLIRLKSADPNTEFQSMACVWKKIQHNLEFISSYGGILELNSAALRKGLKQPYPCLAVCKVGRAALFNYLDILMV